MIGNVSSSLSTLNQIRTSARIATNNHSRCCLIGSRCENFLVFLEEKERCSSDSKMLPLLVKLRGLLEECLEFISKYGGAEHRRHWLAKVQRQGIDDKFSELMNRISTSESDFKLKSSLRSDDINRATEADYTDGLRFIKELFASQGMDFESISNTAALFEHLDQYFVDTMKQNLRILSLVHFNMNDSAEDFEIVYPDRSVTSLSLLSSASSSSAKKKKHRFSFSAKAIRRSLNPFNWRRFSRAESKSADISCKAASSGGDRSNRDSVGSGGANELLLLEQQLEIDLSKLRWDRGNRKTILQEGEFVTSYQCEFEEAPYTLKAINHYLTYTGAEISHMKRDAVVSSMLNQSTLWSVTGLSSQSGLLLFDVYECTLRDALHRGYKLKNSVVLADATTKITVLLSVTKALRYLHARDIVHRSVNSGNILLTTAHPKQLTVKLSDFGCWNHRPAEQGSSSDDVSLHMKSPSEESKLPLAEHSSRADSDKYDTTADIAALGKVIYELWTESVPTPAALSQDPLFKPRSPMDESILELIGDRSNGCLAESSKHRPIAAEILRTLQELYTQRTIQKCSSIYDIDDVDLEFSCSAEEVKKEPTSTATTPRSTKTHARTSHLTSHLTSLHIDALESDNCEKATVQSADLAAISPKFLSGSKTLVWAIAAWNNLLYTSNNQEHFIRVWDATRRNQVATLNGHSGEVTGLIVSCGKLISGSRDKTIRIWDTKTNRMVGQLVENAFSLYSLMICGDLLFSSSADEAIQVWDLIRAGPVHTLRGHKASVRALFVHKEILISGSDDYSIRLWDTSSFKQLAVLKGHKDFVLSMLVFNGMLFSSDDDYNVLTWDLKSHARIDYMPDSSGGGSGGRGRKEVMQGKYLALHEDKLLCAHGKVIHVWDLTARTKLGALQEMQDVVNCMVVADDKLYCGIWNGTVVEYDLARI